MADVDIDPPWRLDPLQNIVNISWGDSLAVEFTERPDYLTLNNALDMNKVIISFWFRIPKETADIVKAGASSFYFDYPVFNGVIPLLTWGPQLPATIYGLEQYESGSYTSDIFAYHPIMLERVTASHSAPMQPSCIGVNAIEDRPTLHVHIQTDDHASGTNMLKIASDFTGMLQEPQEGDPGPVYVDPEYIFEDVSYIITASPDYLGNSTKGGDPEVGAVDKWHHLLISWELIPHSTQTGGGGTSMMWCAIDDKNKAGNDLPAMNDTSYMAPNDHKAWVPFTYDFGGSDGDAVASIDFSPIPSNPVRVPGPASVSYTNDTGGVSTKAPIHTVELAELQIFLGITLDTSEERNRRAFIDFERDNNGKKIVDKDDHGTLAPVDPKKAEELLGRKPDILLHGATRWKSGYNTGSIGITVDSGTGLTKKNSAGQFKPTGVITKFKPDPSLHETK